MSYMLYSCGWTEQALCADPTVDPELFFTNDPKIQQQAKRLCQACPVIEKCRQYALDDINIRGIWGGMNETDRRRFRWFYSPSSVTSYKDCGTYSGYHTHYRNGESPCDSCRLAHNSYRNRRRKRTQMVNDERRSTC
jgi:WhiB family transcriptional regulator, redox-sensing transcriptional regulator